MKRLVFGALCAVASLIVPQSLVSWHALPRITASPGWRFQAEMMGVSGVLTEYVMAGDHMLSRLDWDMQFAAAGVSASAPVTERNVLNFGVVYGGWNEQASGVMEDRDWIEGEATLPGGYSHYSWHPNFLAWHVVLDANMVWNIAQETTHTISALYGLQFSSIKFIARDGFALYPPDHVRQNFSGPVITYRVMRLFPYFGGAVELLLNRRFSGTFFLIGTPLVFSEAYDQHLLTGMDFFDFVYSSTYLHGGLRFSARLRSFTVAAYVAYSHFFLRDGPSYVTYTLTDPNTRYRLGSTGGIGAAYWEFGITAGW